MREKFVARMEGRRPMALRWGGIRPTVAKTGELVGRKDGPLLLAGTWAGVDDLRYAAEAFELRWPLSSVGKKAGCGCVRRRRWRVRADWPLVPLESWDAGMRRLENAGWTLERVRRFRRMVG